MSLKDWWRGLCKSFKKSNVPKVGDFQPEVNEHGLISGHDEEHEGVGNGGEGEEKSISLKKEGRGDKRETIERLEDGFNSLVEQLKGINSNLESQSERHSELMGQMNRLGELIEKFPSVVENQQKMNEQVLDELKANSGRQEQICESVSRIPEEAAKQSEALEEMKDRLSESADADGQIVDGLRDFNRTLGNLEETTAGHRESIMQMSKTFSTSDRYLKYLITKQNKRFMWIFFTSLGVCVGTIILLVLVLVYVKG